MTNIRREQVAVGILEMGFFFFNVFSMKDEWEEGARGSPRFSRLSKSLKAQ